MFDRCQLNCVDTCQIWTWLKLSGGHFFELRNVLIEELMNCPDRKVHGAKMGPTWVLSAPGGPHVGPMNFAICVGYDIHHLEGFSVACLHQHIETCPNMVIRGRRHFQNHFCFRKYPCFVINFNWVYFLFIGLTPQRDKLLHKRSWLRLLTYYVSLWGSIFHDSLMHEYHGIFAKIRKSH